MGRGKTRGTGVEISLSSQTYVRVCVTGGAAVYFLKSICKPNEWSKAHEEGSGSEGVVNKPASPPATLPPHLAYLAPFYVQCHSPLVITASCAYTAMSRDIPHLASWSRKVDTRNTFHYSHSWNLAYSVLSWSGLSPKLAVGRFWQEK